MLEVGGIINARREQDDGGIAGLPVRRRDVAEEIEQFLRRSDPPGARVVPAEKLREHALHHLPVFQHVGDAGGAAPVVLQHEVISLPVADQVGAADVDVDVLGHVEAHELGAEMLRALDDFLRDDPFLQDALVVIDVVQEHVQRRDALDEAALDMLPLLLRDDARE